VISRCFDIRRNFFRTKALKCGVRNMCDKEVRTGATAVLSVEEEIAKIGAALSNGGGGLAEHKVVEAFRTGELRKTILGRLESLSGATELTDRQRRCCHGFATFIAEAMNRHFDGQSNLVPAFRALGQRFSGAARTP
jgi:hypothetical protein